MREANCTVTSEEKDFVKEWRGDEPELSQNAQLRISSLANPASSLAVRLLR